jgi:hypothetical protein
VSAPKPKSVNMRDLKKKLGQEHDSTRSKIKDIEFRIPTQMKDANASLLLAEAERLMDEQGIQTFFLDEFRREALEKPDVMHVLSTIREWFTLVVPTTTWAPVPEGEPIPTPWKDSDASE